MRVAFSGTHRAGKTSLIEAVHARMPRYDSIEEPYRLLEAEGYEFSDPPSAEDFQEQLRRSVAVIEGSGVNTLVDRCPLDFVAYLHAIDDSFDVGEHLDAIGTSMGMLDLVVLVPIETPDRITVPTHENRRLRQRVDRLIQELVLDDPYGLEMQTLEVSGSLDQRVAAVLRRLES